MATDMIADSTKVGWLIHGSVTLIVDIIMNSSRVPSSPVKVPRPALPPASRLHAKHRILHVQIVSNVTLKTFNSYTKERSVPDLYLPLH